MLVPVGPFKIGGGRPRIDSPTVIIHEPINIIDPVYGIDPEKLLS